MANETPAATKPWWQSKTVLLNLVALLSVMIPEVAEWLKKNPIEPVAALGALNVLVRFATNGKVTIFSPDDGSGNGSGASGGGSGRFGEGGYTDADDLSPRTWGVPPWLVGLACAVISLFLLPLLTGCTVAQRAALKEIPITVGIEGKHGTYTYNRESGLGIAVKVNQQKSTEGGKRQAEFEKRMREAFTWDHRREYRPKRMAVPELVIIP